MCICQSHAAYVDTESFFPDTNDSHSVHVYA